MPLGIALLRSASWIPTTHTAAQINRRYGEAAERGIHLHIWAYKELENYLLNAVVIQRVIATRASTGGAPTVDEVRQQMLTICEDEKDTIIDGIAAERVADERSLGTGANKLAREAVKLMWSDEEKRLQARIWKRTIGEAFRMGQGEVRRLIRLRGDSPTFPYRRSAR